MSDQSQMTGAPFLLDALAFEPQFLDHVAPIWRELPMRLRGSLYVRPDLGDRSRARGVQPTFLDPSTVRRGQPSPPRGKAGGTGPMALVASIGDIKVGRRLGYDRFIFVEHGAGQAYDGDPREKYRHPSYAGGEDRDDVILFLCPNEYSARRWREAYPRAAVEIVGSPHVGDLPDRDIAVPGPIVAVSFHWPGFVAPEAHSALGYYARSLPAVAKRWKTLGHAHPKGDWPKRAARTYTRAGIQVIDDFHQICRLADVYVCDNSSTIFEFAATDRPVVVLNMPDYRRTIHHGLRFWEAATVGIQVDRPEELIPAIEASLRGDLHLGVDRIAALKIVYPEDDTRGRIAAGRARDAILETLHWRSEAAG